MVVERVIPGNDAGGRKASAWQLPDVNARAAERRPGVTLDALERVQKAAYDEAFEQGRREGYDAGYAEGREAGLKQGEGEGRQLVQRCRGILDSLSAPAAELDDEVEEELANTVFAIARQVIRRELQRQPGEIIAVIREAVALLPMNARDVRVQVHPEDARFIREALGEGNTAWTLVEDPAVSRGGCVVNTVRSRVDATLESRLSALAADLLGSERRQDRDDPEETAGEEDA